MGWQIILFLLLLVLSAFYSAAETAYTSLSIIQIKELESRGTRQSRRVRRLTERLDLLLTSLLVGNNLANISAATLATALTVELWGSHLVGVTTGVLTIVVLIFAEVTPKRVALEKNLSLCLWSSGFVLLSHHLFLPVCRLISAISRKISGLLIRESRPTLTLENLLQLLYMGESMGIVKEYESRVVKSVLRIRKTPIGEIATHRKDVFSLPATLSVEEALPITIEKGFSRIPLHRENSDDIGGVLLVRDLVRAYAVGQRARSLKELAHRPLFLSQRKSVGEVLDLFKNAHLSMGVILDEYGGLGGVVTQKDIVELILGQFYDENKKKETEKIILLQKGIWIIQGDAPLTSVEAELGLRLQHSPRVFSMGGYLTEQLGQIPQKGASISLPEGSYKVLDIRHNQILSVRFSSLDTPLTPENA